MCAGVERMAATVSVPYLLSKDFSVVAVPTQPALSKACINMTRRLIGAN